MAQKIPDNCYFFSANHGRLKGSPDITRDDILASSDIVEFAVRNGYCKDRNDFDFARCYMDNREWNISYNHCRVRRVLNLLSGENSADEVFMIPKQNITVEMVKSILRDHYEALSPYHQQKPEIYSDRPIAVFRTSFSHINQHRKGLPPDIGSVDYISYGFPDISMIYAVLQRVRR